MSVRGFGGTLRGAGFVFGGGAILLTLAACGGGGGPSPTPVVAATQPQPVASSASVAQVQFTIKWPTPSTTSPGANRGRTYLSNSTKSVSIQVGSAAATVVNNPNLTPGTGSAGTQQTSVVNITAPVGTDSFTVNDYDAIAGAGNLLAANTISFSVIFDQANVVPVTLNGNLGKIGCAPVAPFVSGTSSALVLTGPAGTVQAEPEDADGNIIIAPGNIPAVTLAAPTPAPAASPVEVVSAGASTNQYIVNPLTVATATTINGTGKNLAGQTVTGTCSITRDLAMYVANHGQQGGSPSVSIYDVAAPTSAETPTAIIAGANAAQSQIQFPAVDNHGNLYLSNQGPVPSATYGPTVGYIDVYGPAAYGNTAPISQFTGLQRPTGLSFDTLGNLYSVQGQVLNEYAPGAMGSSAPINTINYYAATGGTDLELGDEDCDGNFVDAAFTLYVACAGGSFTYAKGSTGTVAPTLVITPPGDTSMTFASDSWLGIAADSAGNIYMPQSNNNLNMISKYSSTGTLGTPIKGVYSQPWDIYISPAQAVYLTNFGSSTVDVYRSTTLLTAGVSTVTITSGVSFPYGVTVE